MRIVGLAVIAALSLAACGQNAGQTGQDNSQTPGGQNAQAGGGGFTIGMGGAGYRAESTITGPNGETSQMIMIRDGQRTRMEFGAGMVMILNLDTQEGYSVIHAQRMVMRLPLDQLSQQSPEEVWRNELRGEGARLLGSCHVAGQTGREWQTVRDGQTRTACVTQDGILLRAAEGERVTWETTRVTRGRQDPALFQPPADYRVTDLGQMMQGMENMVNRMKAEQSGQ